MPLQLFELADVGVQGGGVVKLRLVRVLLGMLLEESKIRLTVLFRRLSRNDKWQETHEVLLFFLLEVEVVHQHLVDHQVHCWVIGVVVVHESALHHGFEVQVITNAIPNEQNE